jgi:hypothetical protein
MCSFCIAGLAQGAGSHGKTCCEVNSGVADAADVVITSTSLISGVNMNVPVAVPVAGYYAFSPNLFTGQIGWIAMNNLRVITDNNNHTTPGAGFIIHNVFDENSNTTANLVLTGGLIRYQVFAFVPALCNQIPCNLSSRILSPLKPVEYG